MKALFALAISALTFAAEKEMRDPIANLVNDEFKREASGVRAEWERVSKKMELIESQKLTAAEASKKKGQWEAEGAELVQRFQTVIASRYHNESGEFDSGREVSTRDVDNINKVLGRYLSAMPLKGKVSAGEAMRFLDWAAKRLNSLAKTHLEPNETNNSELEILANQLRVTLREQAKITEIAKTVGLETPGGNTKTVKKSPPKVTTAPMPVVEPLLPQTAPAQAENEEEEEPKVMRLPSSTKKKRLLPSDF